MVLEDELLHRYLKGECSDEERVKVLLWTEEDPQNMKTLQLLSDLYDATIWLDSNKSEKEETKKKRFFLRGSYLKYAGIAAAVFIALFTIKSFLKTHPAEQTVQTVTVPEGQRVVMELCDGTVVTLNSNSKLSYESAFNSKNRKVHLEGEAYFKIAHDAEHPFTIKASGYDVKVLGTEFNLRAYSHDDYELALINGSVRMTGAGMKKTTLKP